jgi:uncharacterized protein YbjT (DUF2867 family)
MRVIVLGAAGRLGREVVRVVAEREHTVCAAVRKPSDSRVRPLSGGPYRRCKEQSGGQRSDERG